MNYDNQINIKFIIAEMYLKLMLFEIKLRILENFLTPHFDKKTHL